MNKLIIALALLSTTAYMAADWSKGQWSHGDKSGWDKSGWDKSVDKSGDKSSWKKSPQEMARLIKHLQKQTIMQPPRLMKKWNDFRADAIKTVAGEVARQILPQIDCPVKRAKYKKLVETMVSLAHQFRNLPVPARPFKISLENLPMLLALKGRFMALKALQLMSVAKQTGAQALLKKAQFKLHLAKKIKQALQLLGHGAFAYDKMASMKTGMKADMKARMHDDYDFDYGNGTSDTGKPMYFIIEENSN